jgi:hypothetical protein
LWVSHPRFLRVLEQGVRFGADLRATFSYGTSHRESDTHIVWRRICRHNVYREP